MPNILTWPWGYKTWVHSQIQNKVQWLAACGHVSASSQSLHFILSLRLYSSFITSGPELAFGCWQSLSAKYLKQANIWGSLSLLYIPNSLFLVNSQICLNCRHKLFTYYCRLLITFANNLDPPQARQKVRHDLDPNCLALYWYSRKIILEKATTRNKLIL